MFAVLNFTAISASPFVACNSEKKKKRKHGAKDDETDNEDCDEDECGGDDDTDETDCDEDECGDDGDSDGDEDEE